MLRFLHVSYTQYLSSSSYCEMNAEPQKHLPHALTKTVTLKARFYTHPCDHYLYISGHAMALNPSDKLIRDMGLRLSCMCQVLLFLMHLNTSQITFILIRTHIYVSIEDSNLILSLTNILKKGVGVSKA